LDFCYQHNGGFVFEWALGYSKKILRPEETMMQSDESKQTKYSLSNAAGDTVGITGANIAFFFFSLVQAMIVARFFGTGIIYDIYLIAGILPEIMVYVVSNLIQATYIPVFLDLKTGKGEAAAWQFFWDVNKLLFLSLLILAILFFWGAEPIVKTLAPDYQHGERALAIRLFRYIIWIAMLDGFIKSFVNLHKTYRSFILPALSNLFLPVAIIGTLLIGGNRLGIDSLIIGRLVGVIAQAIILFPLVSAKGNRYLRFQTYIRNPVIIRLGKLTLPLLIGVAAFRVNVLVDRVIASFLNPGDISVLKYGFQIIIIITSVFGLPFISVVYPEICRQQSSRKLPEVTTIQQKTLRYALMINLPIVVGLVLFAEPLVEILFQRGKFDAVSTLQTVRALRFYAPSVVLFPVLTSCTNLFYGMQRYKTISVVALIMILCNAGFDIVLSDSMGFAGIALATSVVSLTWIAALLAVFHRMTGYAIWENQLVFGAKIITASIVMGAVLWFLGPILTKGTHGMYLFVGIAAGMIIYAALLHLMAIAEFNTIWRWLARRSKLTFDLIRSNL
jgi:putative peptidoglycan lipid II flippase